MKKALIYLFAIFIFAACNNNGMMGGGGWNAQQRNEFMEPCVKGQTKEICSCVLQKLEKKYRSPNQIPEANAQQIGQQLAMECMNGNDNNGGNMNDNNNGNNDNNDGNDFNNNDNNNNDNNFNNDNTGNRGWTKRDKNTFLNDCKRGLTGQGYNNMQAQQLCSCALEILEKKYSSLDEGNRKWGEAAGSKAMQQCMGGGNEEENYDNNNNDNNDNNDNYDNDN